MKLNRLFFLKKPAVATLLTNPPSHPHLNTMHCKHKTKKQSGNAALYATNVLTYNNNKYLAQHGLSLRLHGMCIYIQKSAQIVTKL